MRVILIEDQTAILTLLADLLANKGYAVVACADRSSAVNAINAAQSEDVVVLDWIVPDVEGDELLQAVMNHQANLRCVILSGYPIEIADYPEHWHSRISCLQKPFAPAALIGRLTSLLMA